MTTGTRVSSKSDWSAGFSGLFDGRKEMESSSGMVTAGHDVLNAFTHR